MDYKFPAPSTQRAAIGRAIYTQLWDSAQQQYAPTRRPVRHSSPHLNLIRWRGNSYKSRANLDLSLTTTSTTNQSTEMLLDYGWMRCWPPCPRLESGQG